MAFKKNRYNLSANLTGEKQTEDGNDWDAELKQRFDDELHSIQMTEAAKQQILTRAKKKPNFWNREITIPLPTAAFTFIVFIGIAASIWFGQEPEAPGLEQTEPSGQLISLGSGLFYEKDLQRILQND